MKQVLAETTLALLRIPSVTGEEGPVCDHVEGRLRASLGEDAVSRLGHSLVVAPGPRSPDRPRIALLGHLDTVPPRQDGPVRAEDGRLHGCGASDMKGGVAVMMELLERLPHQELWCGLTCVFYDREEGPYLDNGLGPVLAAFPDLRQTDLAFCLEPSSNRLQLGSMGGIHCTLTFSGDRAHSARPWQGVNAVHRAGSLLADLESRERQAVRFGDLTFYEVMTVTMVEATGTRNVVPDHFAMNLNYRFAPGRTIEEAQADIVAFVDGRCVVVWKDLSPSGPVCLDNPHLAPLLEDPNILVEPKQAWTDVARLGLHGIDAVNLGPGQSAQAHQRNEWCDLDALEEGYALFEEFLTKRPD